MRSRPASFHRLPDDRKPDLRQPDPIGRNDPEADVTFVLSMPEEISNGASIAFVSARGVI